MIGITQPRRVAAMSMASRVAQELSLSASKVSYQIRYDATTSSNTSIKFMTDGVLLRELATDFLLSKYSVIIIDEAMVRGMVANVVSSRVFVSYIFLCSCFVDSVWSPSNIDVLERYPGVLPLRHNRGFEHNSNAAFCG